MFDALIALATLCAVRRVHEQQAGSRPWGVGSVLCVQGIGYVAATGAANLPVAVLAFLDLNGASSSLSPSVSSGVGLLIKMLLGSGDGRAALAGCDDGQVRTLTPPSPSPSP